MERGITRGELTKALDVNCSIDLVYGPIFYRLLITGDTLNGEFIEKLVSLAFEGVRA